MLLFVVSDHYIAFHLQPITLIKAMKITQGPLYWQKY